MLPCVVMQRGVPGQSISIHRDADQYEAQVLPQRWVRYYNQVRPHSSLGGRPPAPQTVIPITA